MRALLFISKLLLKILVAPVVKVGEPQETVPNILQPMNFP